MPRTTLPEAAGTLGGRRPGKPRRDPCALPCTEREHGGTQAVSPRSGSPREARREGLHVPSVSSPGNVARGLHVPLRGKPRERRVREECRICRTADDRTSANGWRRPGAQPPGGEFRHHCSLPDGIMVREVSEDGWGGRRQDPLATEVAAEGLERGAERACFS